MDSEEVTPPFLSLQNTINNGKLFVSIDNLIANISDPIIYNHLSNQKANGIIAKAVDSLDLSHKFKDLEIFLLNCVFTFSDTLGVSYVLSNGSVELTYNIGNTSENQLFYIINGKSLDFSDMNIEIQIYLSKNSKIEVLFKEIDVIINSVNFNHLLNNKSLFTINF